jgi:hypothetical protein
MAALEIPLSLGNRGLVVTFTDERLELRVLGRVLRRRILLVDALVERPLRALLVRNEAVPSVEMVTKL